MRKDGYSLPSKLQQAAHLLLTVHLYSFLCPSLASTKCTQIQYCITLKTIKFPAAFKFKMYITRPTTERKDVIKNKKKKVSV